jgi:hypothetical protein
VSVCLSVCLSLCVCGWGTVLAIKCRDVVGFRSLLVSFKMIIKISLSVLSITVIFNLGLIGFISLINLNENERRFYP